MRKSSRILCLASAFLFCCLLASNGQSIQTFQTFNDGKGGFWLKWDSIQHVLVMYRDVNSPGFPAAAIYQPDGLHTGFYPVADLSGAYYISVFDAAAAPNGGVVIAGIVGYGPSGLHPPAGINRLILRYDRSATLSQAWAVSPYIPRLVAVDKLGNVFAFGDSDLDNPYPMLVKYSPSGSVIHESLPSSFFPQGGEAPFKYTLNGENQMFMQGDTLYLWIAGSQQVLRFSDAGQLLASTSFSQPLQDLAVSIGADAVKLLAIAADSNGDLTAEAIFWQNQPRSKVPVSARMIEMSSGGSAKFLPTDISKQTFLGLAEDEVHMIIVDASGAVTER